jgi:hypothetical protein
MAGVVFDVLGSDAVVSTAWTFMASFLERPVHHLI